MEDRCTYFVSGPNLVHQGIFRCHTCEAVSKEANNVCCCSGCSRHCHAGHDIEYLVNGLAFCDCGAGNCSLMEESLAADNSQLLPGEQHLFHGGHTTPSDHIQFGLHDILSVHSGRPVPEPRDFLKLIADECMEVVSTNKETFWVGSNWRYRDTDVESCDKADYLRCSCMLEELALAIFDYHVHHPQGALFDLEGGVGAFDPERSGAEWWIQVKDLQSDTEMPPTEEAMIGHDCDGPGAGNASQPPAASRAAIDMHYDKDEDIAEKYGVGIFPVVSTVTYLTSPRGSRGALAAQPTVILPITANDPVGKPIFDYIVSYPSVGKHIHFDGRLLHGAPSVPLLDLEVLPPLVGSEKGTRETEGGAYAAPDNHKRVTFLVNVWLNHHPAGVKRLPSEMAAALASHDESKGSGRSVRDAVAVCRRDMSSASMCEVRCEVVRGDIAAESNASADNCPGAVDVCGVLLENRDSSAVRVQLNFGGEDSSSYSEAPHSMTIVPEMDLRTVRLPFVTADSTWGGFDPVSDVVHETAVEDVECSAESVDSSPPEEEEETGLVVQMVVPPSECIAALIRDVNVKEMERARDLPADGLCVDCIRVVMGESDILASCIEYEDGDYEGDEEEEEEEEEEN